MINNVGTRRSYDVELRYTPSNGDLPFSLAPQLRVKMEARSRYINCDLASASEEKQPTGLERCC